MKRTKIVLFGHFGSGNIGNDSSLEAALFNVRMRLPAARIVSVCSGPKYIADRFGIDAREIQAAANRWDRPHSVWARVLCHAARVYEAIKFVALQSSWFRDTSLFVVVGTGAVDDMATQSPWHAPFDLLKWCVAARLGGAQVVFLSVGVGPIRHPLSRWLMLRALRLAHHRSYRETFAIEYLGRHGFDTHRDSICPDLVFSMEMERWQQKHGVIGPPTRIGLGLIYYLGWQHDTTEGAAILEAYMQKLQSVLRWLLERGFTIRLLTGDATDSRCVDEVRALLETTPFRAHRNKVVIEDIRNIDDLLTQIGQTDIVVASRFHNVVCALMMKRPVVSVGYHEKNDLLMAQFGLAAYCQRIESLDVEVLKSQLDDLIARYSALTAGMNACLDKYRHLLEIQYSSLATMHERMQ